MSLGNLAKSAAKGFVDSAIGKFLGNDDGGEKQGFNAQNLISSLNKSGIANASHFEVQLTNPSNKAAKDDERDMMFRADTVELPGRSLATVDHRFDNYSPIARVVTGQTYVDVAVSFLLSEDLREKEYFERWHDSAVDTGAFTPETTGFAKITNNAKYYKSYAGTVTIRQFGANGKIKSVHTLENAYPIVLGGVQMSWGDDSAAKMIVSFSYQRYKVVFYRQDQSEKGMSGSFSFGKGGFSGSLNIPGVGSIGTSGGRIGANLNTQALGKKIFNAL